MKTLLLVALAPALFAAATVRDESEPRQAPIKAGALPAPGTYTLDPPHTFIVFAAQHHVVGMVRGRFDRISGSVTVAKNPAECAVDITVDAGSLSTQNSVRDEDLRSPDFFDVAAFPVATYRGRGIRRAGAGWVMDGSLTIRGVSKVVPLAFAFKGVAPPQKGAPSRVAFRATAATRRADFNMVRELLSEIGVRSARPDVWLEIDAEALAAVKPTP